MRFQLMFVICLVLGISLNALGSHLSTEPSDLEELKQRLVQAENRIKTLENNNGDSQKDYRRFVLEEFPTPIGFTACVSSSDLTSLGNHQTIIFDRAITNTGGAFHNHTGIFIAPIKGLYVFHLTAMTSPGDEQYLAFVKDRTVISHVYPDSRGTTTFQSGSGDWVMELDANSEVWIETLNAGEIHGNCFTIFSGFLLQAME